MFFLDTNVCIEFLRGRLPNAYRLLKQSDPRMFAIPSIVAAELLVGAEKSSRRAENVRLVEQFLLPFESVPFDEKCARAYACVRAELESNGQQIGPLDQLIAATAIAHQATLVTRNVREFARIPGLRLEDWEETELSD